MEHQKLSVEAIENGTVIDHIPAGLGLTILHRFKLLHYGSAVTVGFNLPSKTQGSKDIIKIAGVSFDEAAANRLALFAPRSRGQHHRRFQSGIQTPPGHARRNRRSVPLPQRQLRQPRRAGEKPLLRETPRRPHQTQMPLLRKNLPATGGVGSVNTAEAV